MTKSQHCQIILLIMYHRDTSISKIPMLTVSKTTTIYYILYVLWNAIAKRVCELNNVKKTPIGRNIEQVFKISWTSKKAPPFCNVIETKVNSLSLFLKSDKFRVNSKHIIVFRTKSRDLRSLNFLYHFQERRVQW